MGTCGAPAADLLDPAPRSTALVFVPGPCVADSGIFAADRGFAAAKPFVSAAAGADIRAAADPGVRVTAESVISATGPGRLAAPELLPASRFLASRRRLGDPAAAGLSTFRTGSSHLGTIDGRAGAHWPCRPCAVDRRSLGRWGVHLGARGFGAVPVDPRSRRSRSPGPGPPLPGSPGTDSRRTGSGTRDAAGRSDRLGATARQACGRRSPQPRRPGTGLTPDPGPAPHPAAAAPAASAAGSRPGGTGRLHPTAGRCTAPPGRTSSQWPTGRRPDHPGAGHSRGTQAGLFRTIRHQGSRCTGRRDRWVTVARRGSGRPGRPRAAFPAQTGPDRRGCCAHLEGSPARRPRLPRRKRGGFGSREAGHRDRSVQ